MARGDGSYARLLMKLAKLDLLAIDDWLLHPLKESERRDLMEVIEDCAERGSTLVATQIPIKQWHAAIGDPNHADVICDRILHRAHRITLKGASLRKTKAAQGIHRHRCMSGRATIASMRQEKGETAKTRLPGDTSTKRPRESPQETFSRPGPYPRYPSLASLRRTHGSAASLRGSASHRPGLEPRLVAAYGSGKVASLLSLCPLPPAPTSRPCSTTRT